MALEGSLKDFGLADILQLIYFQRKTGVLALEGRTDRVRFLFIDGNIAGAESRRRLEANRLGKVLVKKGLLEENELKSVLDEQRSSDARLGNILVKKGIVEKEPIQEILTGQIKEKVVQIFGWKQGTYEFKPRAVPSDKVIPISLDTQHLLMEGLSIVHEWSVIESKLTLDTVFRKKTEDIAVLSEEQEEILSLVDGENDVTTIIDISAKDDALVSKILVSLMEKGAIEPKEAAPVVTVAVPIGIKKPVLAYRFIPLLAIAVSFLLSLFPMFLNKADIFKKFSASETIEDLRFEIEAYKFKHSSYPEILDEISKKSDPWGNPYVYKQNAYTFTILSAGADGKEGTSDDLY